MSMAAPRSAMGRIRTSDSPWLQNWVIMGLVVPFKHFLTASGSVFGLSVVKSVKPSARMSKGAWMKMNLL
jgi:hypothetical protein